MLATGLKTWRHRFGLESPPSTGFREGLQWLMVARLGMLYLALSMLVLQQVFRREVMGPTLFAGYALLSLSFAFNLLNSFFLEKVPQRPWFAGLHILFDALTNSVDPFKMLAIIDKSMGIENPRL